MTTEVAVRDATVSLNGLRFHYRDWGTASAPPLLLLHGHGSLARAWDGFAARMADCYRVLALDQRGHGETDWTTDYEPDRMAEDVDAFRRALRLPRCAVLGLSMGAANAFLFTARHPEAVERLVIADIGPDTPDFMLRLRADQQRDAPMMWPGIVVDFAEARRLLASQPPLTFDDPEEAIQAAQAANPRQPVVEVRARILSNLVQGQDGRWTWRYDPLLRTPIVSLLPVREDWALLAAVRCPTLVVRGAESPVLTHETAERMVRALPNGRLAEVPDSGHSVPQDNLDGFVAAVRPFLLDGVGGAG
jgi:pimeloyl-ACP methyl ester carboxylesterase